MLRENAFRVGGALCIALGAALAYGLVWAGAGFEYAGAWLAAGLAAGFGGFFFYVAQDEARRRREFIGRSEAEPLPATERRSP